jgi:hypothetical protein
MRTEVLTRLSHIAADDMTLRAGGPVKTTRKSDRHHLSDCSTMHSIEKFHSLYGLVSVIKTLFAHGDYLVISVR